MTVYHSILPGAISIAHSSLRAGILNERAKFRLSVLDWHRDHGLNISLTARHFGIDRKTIRRWRMRLARQGPSGLNDLSHRPHRLRTPTTSHLLAMNVIALRKQYPSWSKYKIQALLMKQGVSISPSTIGRILKRRGLIDRRVSSKKRHAATHPKARFPKGLSISQPGDLIQMNTKHIMLIGGKRFFQFTAIDVLTKQRVLMVYSTESSRCGATFLAHCLQSFPFSIKAIQTDNGAPFSGRFQKLCLNNGLPHYFIHPRTPKENTYVEISHQADKREFYAQGNICSDLVRMRERVKRWEDVWNRIRPHQALNYLTPREYFDKWQNGKLPTKDVITLQA